MFDEGRFGPVYRSHDPETNQPVLVRTFALQLTPDEQARLVDALNLLCESPLDHQSIARPLVAGIENGRPFLVHTLLPGESLQRFLETHGPLPFSDVVLRVTQLAAAIDFAAAAGVYHGDLGTRDVIVAPETAGISGFGVVQALIEAGVHPDGPRPTRSGDIEALARVAFEMLQGRAPAGPGETQSVTAAGADTALLQLAFGAALSKDANLRPDSALEFAAALQHALLEPAKAYSAPPGVGSTVTKAGTGPSDLPLRDEPGASRFAADPEPALALDAFEPEDPPLRRDERPMTVPEIDRQERVVPAPMFAAVVPAAERTRESSERSGWLLVAAALAIGIFSGFAAGFVVGQRGGPLPVPRVAADAIGTAPSAPAAPAPTAGVVDPDSMAGTRESVPPIPESDITSRALEPGSRASDPDVATPAPREAPGPTAAAPTASSPSAAAPPAAPARPPLASGEPGAANTPKTTTAQGTPDAGVRPPAAGARTGAPASSATIAGPRVSPETPGGLQVLSRPAGADVFVDGALVGKTPLVIATVAPGAHDVRIDLAGHRQWATSVRVEPGERARVAASLEQ